MKRIFNSFKPFIYLIFLVYFISCQKNGFKSEEFLKTRIDSSKYSSISNDSLLRIKLKLKENIYNQLLKEDSIRNKFKTSFIEKNDTSECGTYYTPEDFLKEFPLSFLCSNEIPEVENKKILVFQVVAHAINDGLNESDFKIALENVNKNFKSARIQFELVTNLKLDPRYSDFITSRDEKELTGAYEMDKKIHIFIVNSILKGNEILDGYTYMSDEVNFIFINAGALNTKNTFSHEMGHFFSLLHTHGPSESTLEFVNETNCSCDGDMVCDTPADPNLYKYSLNNCIYKGDARDQHNELYKPDPSNIMSYGFDCRNTFTEGQFKRMRWAALKRKVNFINKFLDTPSSDILQQ